MKNRKPAIVAVALIGVVVVGLAVALAQRMGQPAPATPTPQATPTRPPTWTPTPSRAPYPAATPTPGPSPLPTEVPLPPAFLTLIAYDATQTAVAFEPTMTAMAALGTIIPSPTRGGPTPTMTGEEQALLAEIQHGSSQSAASVEECGEILMTEPWCSVYWHARRITRPEWEELFPGAVFYLAKRDRYGGDFVQHLNRLIVEQTGRRFPREDFHRLLGWNQIVISDENRELVAKAFVLISLPDYLEDEIVFSDWQEGSWPSRIQRPYNYSITSWTRIQGLKMEWYFMFDEEGLRGATGYVAERNVGDYVDVPFYELPPLRTSGLNTGGSSHESDEDAPYPFYLNRGLTRPGIARADARGRLRQYGAGGRPGPPPY